MAKVMVLAAGRGSRLGALTMELPKPLVPVGDRPMLRHILDTLELHGIGRVVINTHHLSEQFSQFDAGQTTLSLVYEPRLRGTAGGVFGARPQLAEHCVVWNSDIFIEPPIGELLRAAEKNPITLLVTAAPKPRGRGTVGLAKDGAIVRLRGEIFGEEACGADYVGVAALGREVMQGLPRQGCLVGDVCVPRLRSGAPVLSLPFSGAWTDLGTPASYLALNLDWLKRTQRSQFLGSGVSLEAGVRADNSVIGFGARGVGTGEVRRCVVWPGATFKAPLQDAVVLGSGKCVQIA